VAATLPSLSVANADSNVTTEGTRPQEKPKEEDTVIVTYTIWVGTDVTENFTISVIAEKNSSFYHVMQTAAEQDPHYL
jgi:hypothetical protein